MKILVTGGTGNVGSGVVQALLARGADVRVLSRKQPEAGKLPEGVEVATGNLLDPVSLEQAMQGVDKLFLLNAVVADELTQALIAYGVARRVGLKHVPGYFMQNDASLQSVLMGAGIYPMPLGGVGICAVDVRDIVDAAAISLTAEGHEGQTYDLVGPTLISGPGNAALWSKLLGREIRYTGHDFDQFEQQLRGRTDAWHAFDLRMMFQGYFDRGFVSTETEVARLTKLLGHAPRSYEAFATETAQQWQS